MPPKIRICICDKEFNKKYSFERHIDTCKKFISCSKKDLTDFYNDRQYHPINVNNVININVQPIVNLSFKDTPNDYLYKLIQEYGKKEQISKKEITRNDPLICNIRSKIFISKLF
jgi:hypothetical protein